MCQLGSTGNSSWPAMGSLEFSNLDHPSQGLEESVMIFGFSNEPPYFGHLSSFQLVHVFLPVPSGR